jgi:7-carboxy-7-deazaguanine synthase
MRYAVKEIYFTVQGEGHRTGCPAVFVRFAGCNLWSGREVDRPRAVCRFCDTAFVGTGGPGGGRFATPVALAEAAKAAWVAARADGGEDGTPFTVLTGGEPALQLDPSLVAALHRVGFEIGIETNGTLPLPPGIDWVCVSPKAGAALEQITGDELKLVYPQTGAEPGRYEHLDFRHFSLQPMDGPDVDANTRLAAEFCRRHPRWRLSRQMHKVWGIP